MENEKYCKLVESGMFPTDAEVSLDSVFSDGRGEIVNVLLTPITSVARITSRAGSIRANHYHKSDWHYALVERGCILYFEREIGELNIPEPRVFRAGQMFFTRPNIEHSMLFKEDTVFFTFAKNVRTHENHESDLERVAFVTPEIAALYLE